MCLYINGVVDDTDAGIAASLVCNPDHSIFSVLSQPGLADFQRHRHVVLSKVCDGTGAHADLGPAGGISAPVYTPGSRTDVKKGSRTGGQSAASPSMVSPDADR